MLGRGEAVEAARRAEMESGLYEEIGRLKVELNWLKKKYGALAESSAGS